ncbi:MAG: DNA-directed RNA polymerase subunit H [Methanobrevibacter sp. CfCl-M3]
MKKDILMHELVPEHKILSESDKKKVFKDLECNQNQLPKIKITDPVVEAIDAKEGDVLEISRKSETAGTFITYRLVEP